MANVIIGKTLNRDEKINLMNSDARFDVADQEAEELSGIYDDVRAANRARPAPPKVPKIFMTNDCLFNCAYCTCRAGREDEICRYVNPPRELAEIAVSTAKKNGHGVFISSAIYKHPDYTEELIVETLRIIRNEMGYKGYLHAKVMPGTDPELIRRAGMYANRLSVNIEVAHSRGYELVAKNKSKANILAPMRSISELIAENYGGRARFASSQTTQLMAGSTDEDDYTILNLSGALYKKYRLSRVYYTPFTYQHSAAGYESLPARATPAWRVGRLYQADRLMQLYGFTADEIAPTGERFLDEDIDPKAAWALRHMDMFPVEVRTADREALLRVPGIGLTFADRIIEARKFTALTHDSLKALGLYMNKSRHFITCGGKFEGDTREDVWRLREILSSSKNLISSGSKPSAPDAERSSF